LNIRGLAKHLNLSIATVSRALNNSWRVTPETKERVRQAARQLGYTPSQSGRPPRQGITGMIAMVLPTNPSMLADTAFLPVVDGLRVFLAERSVDLLVLVCGPNESAFDYLRRVAARRLADGFIIVDTQRIDPRIDFLIETKMPFVAFGRTSSGGSHPWIDLDFEGAAEFAIDRLVANGHRRIALGSVASELSFGYACADAYRAALTRHGLTIDSDVIIHVENSEDGGYRFGDRLVSLSDRPTAALLGKETMAIGLYRRLSEAGLSPARDLSIIAFGEGPSVRFLSPKVTCFRTKLRELGMRLGEALLPAIPGYVLEDSAPVVQEIWPMEFVPGESDRRILSEAPREISSSLE